MIRQLVPQIDLFTEVEFAAAPAPVVTATIRLARELRRQYDNEHLAAGRLTWPSPDILPISSWLAQLWRDWLYSGRAGSSLQLLRPSQESAVWEDVVRSSAGGDQLFQVARTAEAVMDAWNLACAWQLPHDAPEWNDSEDSEAFRRWRDEFLGRCKANGWLSGALLGEFIADRIDDGAIDTSQRIRIAGFIETTPVLERLIESLRRKGTDVEVREETAGASRAVRIRLIDQEAEVRAAAGWARQSLEAARSSGGSAHRIGIIVPDLAAYRSRIERVFGEQFHPGGRLAPERDAERVFNISLGLALAEYPLVDAALRILWMNPQTIPLEDAGRLLRSPFISGAPEEHTRRGLLDRQLRGLREPAVGLGEIIAMARARAEPFACPKLAVPLARWRDEWSGLPAVQRPSEWVSSVSGLLRAIGWPGDRTPSSAEYQTAEAWNELLSELAGMDRVTGSMTLSTALSVLQRLANARQFQPESEPVPIQILGVFESSGLRFDQLWIMGMHDAAWPPSSGPNPFLPFRLQRRFNMPQSSPKRELEFATLLAGRMLSGAPEVVVSNPEREADSDLRPSPLFVDLPETSATELGVFPGFDYAEELRLSSRMETINDHEAPPWTGSEARGGTAIFSYQAACPFRAFGQLRLGADAHDVAQPGLSALDRGLLIHGVLERVWAQLGSHAGLMSTDEDKLAALVRMTSGAAIQEMSPRRRALRHARFATIEQARLQRLVTEWLELEKARQPFSVLHREEKRRVRVSGIDIGMRADRVDVLEDGTLVVIDYKTGLNGPSRWESDRPDEPQLPLYAVAAESEVSGVFFGTLRIGEVGFRGLAVAEGLVPGVRPNGQHVSLAVAIENWRAVLDRLGREFRAGKAPVDPKKPGATCRHCPLTALCRINDAGRRGGPTLPQTTEHTGA